MNAISFRSLSPFSLRPWIATFLLLISATWALANSPYSGIITFGDSLSDRGNTISVIGHSAPISWFSEYDNDYYAADYNVWEIAAEGRWSSGPTWVEYLAANLATQSTGSRPIDLGQNSGTGTSGTNFAWAGSTSGTGKKTIAGIFELDNLQTQVANYITLSTTTTFLPEASTALFTVWSGGNDAIDWVGEGADPLTKVATAQQAADNVTLAINSLYINGARHFLIPNLPSLGLKPDLRLDPAKRDAANSFVDIFNARLSLNLQGLRGLLSEASMIELDVHSFFLEVIDNPSLFNLENVTDQAWTYGYIEDTLVDNPHEYLFWDNTHPTTQVHQIIGNMAYFATIPEPGTVGLLIVGVGLIGAMRLRRRAA